jgi:Domain of unknown function (DUF1707)
MAAGVGGRTHMRASQAFREQVIDMLKTAFVQGRLATDEFDLRVGQVLASRTYADLNALTADIPTGLIRAQSPNPARKLASVPTPKAVRDAVRLMCLGAVLTLAVSVTVLLTLGSVRSGFVHDPAAGQWHTFMLTQIVPGLASAPIGAGLWLWLAWGTAGVYHWARPRFHGAVRRPHFCAALQPRRGRRRGRLDIYLARRDRRDGALAGRAGGGAAHLQRDGQPVLPAPSSNASSNTGERNRTVADQLDSKCLHMPKDRTNSDGSDHG